MTSAIKDVLLNSKPDTFPLAKEIKEKFENIDIARTPSGELILPAQVMSKSELFIKHILDLITDGKLKYLIFPKIGAEIVKYRISEELKHRGFDISIIIVIDAEKGLNKNFVYSENLEIIGNELGKVAVIDDVFDTGGTGDKIAQDISTALKIDVNNFLIPFYGLSYKIIKNPEYKNTEPIYFSDATLLLEDKWILGSCGMDSGKISSLEFLSNEEKAECIALERLAYLVLILKDNYRPLLRNRDEYNYYRELLIRYCIVEDAKENLKSSPLFQIVYNLEFAKLSKVEQ